MSNAPLIIDRLEDLLIDNPDKATQKEILETLFDETFQHKLNARAEQIRFDSGPFHERSSNSSNVALDPDHLKSSGHLSRPSVHHSSQSLFFATESRLVYNYTDNSGITTELSQWFASDDFELLGPFLELAHNFETKISKGDEYLLSDIKDLRELLLESDHASMPLEEILYFSLGQYRSNTSKEEQIEAIQTNAIWLIKHEAYLPLISLLVKFATSYLAQTKADIAPSHVCSRNLLMTMTTLYFMLVCSLSKQRASQAFLAALDESDVLTLILRLIENWRWTPTSTTRPRQLILLLWKLILFEFGGTKEAHLCDEYLREMYKVKSKASIGLARQALTCSPVSYLAFREDMMDKYPMSRSSAPQSREQEKQSSSNKERAEQRHELFMAMNSYATSVSNSIETPCTQKTHTVFGMLPAQTIHIATPVPSPTLIASDYMLGGEKVRRSYQVNQSMPFIYPHDEDDKADVPAAIKEANEIMVSSIYESYSTKRLWEERQKFMQQERGYLDAEFSDSDPTGDWDLQQEKPLRQHIRALQRVEKFYSRNLSRLSSLVQVLMGVIQSNHLDLNLNFAEWELNPETSYLKKSHEKDQVGKSVLEEKIRAVKAGLLQKLEAQRLRETTTKAASAIICLLLKWFKLSHILKHYYFSTLLYDLDFLGVTLDYLGRAFYNSNLQSMARTTEGKLQAKEYEQLVSQNQLMNPAIDLPDLEFFNVCQGRTNLPHHYCFINKELLPSIKPVMEINNVCSANITSYNPHFAFILANLLEVTNKILVKHSLERMLAMNELKPTELYKMILTNYDNARFSTPMLKIIKKLVPYQGRKWKSTNMDLILQVYLKGKLSLRDNWLSGKDLEGEFNNSHHQEVALRALLQFYNRKYPDQMEAMGYAHEADPDVSYLTLNEAGSDPAQ